MKGNFDFFGFFSARDEEITAQKFRKLFSETEPSSSDQIPSDSTSEISKEWEDKVGG